MLKMTYSSIGKDELTYIDLHNLWITLSQVKANQTESCCIIISVNQYSTCLRVYLSKDPEKKIKK